MYLQQVLRDQIKILSVIIVFRLPNKIMIENED